jgi:hypothetical protein
MEPQSQLDKIAPRLNQRPRKTLGFQTPASKLRASATPTLEPARLTGQVASRLIY